MKKLLFLLLIPSICFAAPPTRVNTYSSGSAILASDVTANEDALFNYLSAGVDVIKDGTIVNADVNGSANIQSDKLNLTAIAQNVKNTGTLTNVGNFTLTGAQTISSTLSVTGTINTAGVYDNGMELIPQGAIIMWSGATLPDGWELCDGTCSITCPDLRDKFIVGAGSTYAVTDTGGATTHTHSVSKDGWGSQDPGEATGRLVTTTEASGAALDTAANNLTSGSGSTLPPYRGLYFIIKI